MIENVEDVVSLDAEVWVKVVDVREESIEDESTGRTRTRHRLRLSMKYVDQGTGEDLDPDGTAWEEDRERGDQGGRGSREGAGASSGGDGGTGGADTQLGRALTSNIGMSSAIDLGNLILKGRGGGTGGASFNGYALVGEDEGEVEMPEHNELESTAARLTVLEPNAARPSGHGAGRRGATGSAGGGGGGRLSRRG